MKKLRTLSALLLLITLLTLSLPINIAYGANQPTVITQTVNLAAVSKNESGAGYDWANLTDTLTLENLNINTADEFGMKLPEKATVILKGNNFITAASVGLVCTGEVIFEGDGTLTITAGDVGIDLTGVQTVHRSRFTSGTITVTAGKTAIRSAGSELSFMGTKLSINVNGDAEEKRAISGRTVTMSSGEVTANAQVYASNALIIAGINATVTAPNGAAIECPNGIKMSKVDISVGANADSLAKAEAYNGESAIKLISTNENKKNGILFGGKYHRSLDYVVFITLLLAVAALIAVPIYLKKKKTEKLIAEYKAANPPKKPKTAPKGKK